MDVVERGVVGVLDVECEGVRPGNKTDVECSV